jgi:hypothetical protein
VDNGGRCVDGSKKDRSFRLNSWTDVLFVEGSPMITWFRFWRVAAAGALFYISAAQSTIAGVTDDRRYLLGDDPGENAAAGTIVGSNSLPQTGFSRDSQGPSGAFIHLAVSGAPTYVSVADRPGAAAGALGASFGGPGTGDRLSTPFSLNSPSDHWDNRNFYPLDGDPNTPLFSLNYEGVMGHGIQLWVKPNSATQNVRQDLVIDTPQNGIYISPTNRWGLQFSNQGINSSAPVAFNAWTHVMQVAGSNDPDDGRSNLGSALYVNGVAVAASGAFYGFNESALSIGSNQDASGNFFRGAMDNVRLFIWGDNSRQSNGGAGPNGQDWGDFNLGEDNEWIANQLTTLGVTDSADVNLDGIVNNADVTSFLPDWHSVRLINGRQVGDWISRQNGDLNYDGMVDLDDAYLLHDGLVAAGIAGGLNFSLLGVAVPEPASFALAMMSLLGPRAARRRAV